MRPRSAFTLIELLTALAVIAILGAILIPVVGSVRAKSNVSKGASNPRQLGVGFQLYASENGGKIPYQQGSDSMTWHVEIGRYVNQFENEEWADLAIRNQRPPDVFACPAAEETVRFGNYSHFGMNPVVGDNYSNSTQKSHFVIPNPARTILLADVRNCIRLLGLWDEDGRLAARHPGDTVNVLYLDGHVDNVEIAKLTTDITGDRRFQEPWGWPGWTQ